MLPPPADSPAPPWISLSQTVRRYGRREALRATSLELGPGDVAEIIGANGTGKSTLLRILVGFTRPSSGRVVFSKDFRGGRVILVPQTGGLYTRLTVLQNIEIMARLLGSAIEIDDRLVTSAHALGIADLMNTRVAYLSGGYQRLAGIAAAFAAQPDAIFLDEPLSALDEQAQQKVFALMQSWARPERIVVFTVHAETHAPWLTKTIAIDASGVAVAAVNRRHEGSV